MPGPLYLHLILVFERRTANDAGIDRRDLSAWQATLTLTLTLTPNPKRPQRLAGTPNPNPNPSLDFKPYPKPNPKPNPNPNPHPNPNAWQACTRDVLFDSSAEKVEGPHLTPTLTLTLTLTPTLRHPNPYPPSHPDQVEGLAGRLKLVPNLAEGGGAARLTASLGSATARLPRLHRARPAARGGSRLPRGRARAISRHAATAASKACGASHLQRRRCHRLLTAQVAGSRVRR